MYINFYRTFSTKIKIKKGLILVLLAQRLYKNMNMTVPCATQG